MAADPVIWYIKKGDGEQSARPTREERKILRQHLGLPPEMSA